MSLTNKAIQEANNYFSLKEDTPIEYAHTKYPKLLPIMRFEVHRYSVDNFGTITTMDTNAMFGMMKLSTFVFTPSIGLNVPFLLIDTMCMKNKSLAYVEYYDCTKDGASLPEADKQVNEFAKFKDYNEKPAWYINRRTPYSLIKEKGDNSQDDLDNMVLTCLKRYLEGALNCGINSDNLIGLYNFQQEMLDKGNPSSETLDKVLGKEGAKTFFEKVIMPVNKLDIV